MTPLTQSRMMEELHVKGFYPQYFILEAMREQLEFIHFGKLYNEQACLHVWVSEIIQRLPVR